MNHNSVRTFSCIFIQPLCRNLIDLVAWPSISLHYIISYVVVFKPLFPWSSPIISQTHPSILKELTLFDWTTIHIFDGGMVFACWLQISLLGMGFLKISHFWSDFWEYGIFFDHWISWFLTQYGKNKCEDHFGIGDLIFIIWAVGELNLNCMYFGLPHPVPHFSFSR